MPNEIIIDDEMTEFLDGVIGLVEANGYEQHMLWCECQELKWSWESVGFGLMEIVGHLAGMPVCIRLHKNTVRGELLLFMHATSQVVDHRLIDKWVDDIMPASARRANGSVNRTDAMNFSNIFRG